MYSSRGRPTTHQQVGDGQVHEHRVDPRAGLAPALQDYREHRDVADGRDHHEYAVGDDGYHVPLVEPHVVRQTGLVEEGSVFRVGRVVGPAKDLRRTGDHAFGHRVQHRAGVRFHHVHGGGGNGKNGFSAAGELFV